MSVVIDSSSAGSTDKQAYDAEFEAAISKPVYLEEEGAADLCGWTDITPT